jgi:hypothetical protein
VTGCPKCGSKRLRSAPLPLVFGLAALFAKRWRYACPHCRWVGWKRRMRRTDQLGVAEPEAEAASDTIET